MITLSDNNIALSDFMNQVLVKPDFVRLMPGPLNSDSLNFEKVTQADFLREYDPRAHNINFIDYYPNLVYIDGESPSKVQMKVRARTAIAWQRRIHTKRLVALTGYDPDITSSRSKTDPASQQALADFKEGWAVKKMDAAVHLSISADLKVADTAFCGYKSNGRFGYRLFSFDKGDTLYPHYDPMTGELVLFARAFQGEVTQPQTGIKETVTFVDVWDDAYYAQFRGSASWEALAAGEWVRTVAPKLHAFPFCPVAYHRYGEPCWAGSQSLIEKDELAMSQLAENNAQYALRILYTLGADFEMAGSTDGTPNRIDSTDPNAKVGFLEPADSSGSYELQLKTLEREIMRCSFAVESPELKSGADVSSLTVKTLMADSYLKALDDSKQYQSYLDRIVDIFVEGYGTETQKRSQFLALNVSATLHPYVFMSESEVVNTLVQLVSVGVLSKRSATEYVYETLGLGSLDEAKRLLQEAHDELTGEQALPDDNVINSVRNGNV